MKIALIGYGKMGKMVEQIALSKGHSIVAKIHQLNKEGFDEAQQADVWIDFTHPDCVMEHVKKAAHAGKNLVIGTTGWEENLDQANSLIQHHQIGCIYAPNFSIGVHLFLRMVGEAASIIDQFDDYDIAALEYHHNQKADNPSGTAKRVANTLIDRIRRKTAVVYDLGNRKIREEELHFSTIRCGAHPGTHEVVFDSSVDTITLSHTARSREGFARGAVAAAEWIEGKTGLYTLEEMMNNLLD